MQTSITYEIKCRSYDSRFWVGIISIFHSIEAARFQMEIAKKYDGKDFEFKIVKTTTIIEDVDIAKEINETKETKEKRIITV